MHNGRRLFIRTFCTSTTTSNTTTPPPPFQSSHSLANSAAAKLKREGVKIGGVRGDGLTPRWFKTVEVVTAPKPTSSPTISTNNSTTTKYYTLKMDSKQINTPKENKLAIPSELLANAIAAEWESQDTLIKPTALPLTRLATASIDLIPMYRAEIIESLVNILKTDTACCREGDREDLHEIQEKAFRPLVDWLGQRFGVPPKVSFSFGAINQPEYLLSALRDYLTSLDDYHIAALEQLTNTVKSIVIALGLVHDRITIEQAVKIARLEETFQTDKWGIVEGGHDLDKADLAVKVSAASFFWRLLPQ